MSASGPDVEFRAALKEGLLRIQRCDGCDRHIFFPRIVCPHCGGMDISFVDATGKGVVYATTIVRRRAEKGGDYNVALIDLAEGVRMMSRVEGISPDQVVIGMPVVAFVDDVDGAPGVLFKQAEA